MEPGALLGAEPEPATVVARPPDSEPLGERHNPCAGLGAERGVIEAGLALAPAGVGARERAVVAIPYRERPGIQTIEDPLRGPTLPALCVVVSAELGERRHRHGIEAPAVAGPPDSAGERREHLVLPAEVVLLRVAVADPEVCGVGTDPAHRAVTEAAAEDDLPLVVGQLVILDRHEDVAADREVAGAGRPVWREYDVALGRREVPSPCPTAFHLELHEMVGAAVVEPADDAAGLDLAGRRVPGEHLEGQALVDDLADLHARPVGEPDPRVVVQTSKHYPYLLAGLVDEDDDGARARDGGGEFPHALRQAEHRDAPRRGAQPRV